MSEWRRPTDDAYAFELRALDEARAIPPMGAVQHIRDVARRALVDGDARRLGDRVQAWAGPEDMTASGDQPFIAPQDRLVERPWQRLALADLDEVLCGTARVMRRGSQTDYVLRDHHMLDVVLYHYVTTGTLPSRLFHADRHSDFCRDGYLLRRVPAQAATWWTLLEGIKRPDSGMPVLGENDVAFTTAQPGPEVQLAGRDVGASVRVPWWVNPADLPWPRALERPEALECDWVSLDLDYFQPLEQLALTKGLLRDPRFHGLMAGAKVRVFVLSPQFTAGGDVLEHWTIAGRRHASLRMLNLVRGMGMRTRPL